MSNSLRKSIIAMSFALCVANSTTANSEDADITSFRYSQYYWNEHDGGGTGPNRNEWIQGLQFNRSKDLIGKKVILDFSYGIADSLYVGDSADSVTNLPTHKNVRHPGGLAKPLALFVRSEWKNSLGDFTVGGGKTIRSYAQYADDVTRILPSGSIGFDSAFKSGAFATRYSQIQAFSPRDENGWGESLTNFSGKKISHLDLYALSFNLMQETPVKIEYSEAQNYLRSGSIKISNSINTDSNSTYETYATYGFQQDAGSLFEHEGVPGRYEPEQSHDARYLDLSFRFKAPDFHVGASYNKVMRDDFDRTFFKTDYGSWNSSAKLLYFFGLRDEEMFKITAGMNFAKLHLPNLRWDAHYATSDHAHGYNGFSRREFQSLIQYQFRGVFNGLSLAWLYNRFHTEATPSFSERSQISLGPAGIIAHHANRVYLSYTYTFK